MTLLIESLALLRDFDTLRRHAQQMNPKLRTQVLSRAVNSLLNDFHAPKCALELWLTICEIDYPGLQILHKRHSQQPMTILYSILMTYENFIHIMRQAFAFIDPQNQQNFVQLLSYSYYRLELWDKSVRLWEQTPDTLKTSSGLVHTIKACSYLGQYNQAMELFRKNEALHTLQVKKAMVPIVTGMHYKDHAFTVLIKLIDEGVVMPYKTTRVLETLLREKRIKEFDDVAKAYKAHNTKISPTFYNTLMERELLEPESNKFFSHLRSIYSSEMNPTSKTFRLLFQQQTKRGNIAVAMSLLEVLVQSDKEVNVHHFTQILRIIENADDISPLYKVLGLMKRLNIQPDQEFNTALMSVNYKFNQYSEVQKLFFLPASNSPNHEMIILLMKSYLSLGNVTHAKAAMEALKQLTSRRSYPVLLAQMEFHCYQGDFLEALKVLEIMKSRGMIRDRRPYAILMKGYNKHKQYDNTVVVYNMIVADGQDMSSYLYRELLVALVKLNVINNENFYKPTEVVDNLMESYRQNKLPMSGKLRFKSIKPLVNELVKHYRPAEANRLMQNFKVIRPEFDVDYNLNFMKQEMSLFAHERVWNSFGVVFTNFQQRIRNILVEDAYAPVHLKKMYGSVIKPIFKYHLAKNDLESFTQLFQDLIFVHGFSFDSKNMNWVARRLLRNESTFHEALKVIDGRLIGGYIAKRMLSAKNLRRKRAHLPVLVASSKGAVKRPYLRLGYLHRQELVNTLYVRIKNSMKKDMKRLDETMGVLTKKYPRLMRNLPELHQRFQKRKFKKRS
jgi:tetratricopeptide (TPR) repeat protein